MNQQDDSHAHFLRSFMACEPRLRSYIRRLVPARTDVDDLMQETAVVLWSKFSTYQPGTDFAAWAQEIARYKVLSSIRDMRRDRLILSEEVIEMLADESDEEAEQFQQQREILNKCFVLVPPKERTLLIMAYQPQVKINELASNSGRSVHGFYQWLHRLRQNLMKCVQKQLAKGNASL